MPIIRYLLDAFVGPEQARKSHRRVLRQGHGIPAGIEALSAKLPPDTDSEESPIFLLSAGWRSGSTLLQRLIMSDKDVLIWGEPYDECGLIQNLASSIKAFRPGWPREDYFYDGTPIAELSGNWVANLFPDLESWRNAQKALFQTLFAAPAESARANRWGIKEVRLNAEHCHYLKWLYPRAKFIFLYRNPYDAYKSYCSFGRNWYDTYPDRPVFTPRGFGQQWRSLMDGFLLETDELDALLVKYEDLISDVSTVEQVESHLDVTIDRSLLRLKVRNSGKVKNNPTAQRPKVKLSALEKWLLRRAVAPTASKLGYHDIEAES